MPGSPRERQDRIDALLSALSENGGRAKLAALVTLAVRSWGVNRKTAKDYADHLLAARWADLDGYDLVINSAGRKHLLAINDWDLELPAEAIRRTKARARKPAPPTPPPTQDGEAEP